MARPSPPHLHSSQFSRRELCGQNRQAEQAMREMKARASLTGLPLRSGVAGMAQPFLFPPPFSKTIIIHHQDHIIIINR